MVVDSYVSYSIEGIILGIKIQYTQAFLLLKRNVIRYMELDSSFCLPFEMARFAPRTEKKEGRNAIQTSNSNHTYRVVKLLPNMMYNMRVLWGLILLLSIGMDEVASPLNKEENSKGIRHLLFR